MARTLQNRLALAQFKAKNGWQDLTLVEAESKLDERLRLQRPTSSGDLLSDTSSSSTYSDFNYPRALASSPMKGPIFSDALQPSSGSSSGRRKRTYNHTFNGNPFPTSHNPARKRFREAPEDFNFNGHNNWKGVHELAQSSPIKPRYQHFTTAAGPDLSFYHTSNSIPEENFMSTSSEEDDLLPMHSFQMPEMQRERNVSPPRTPPPIRSRPGNRRSHTTHGRVQHPQHANPLNSGQSRGQGQEGADLLLYLATSPSPAQPRRDRFTGGNTFLPTHSHSKSFTDSFISTEAMKSNGRAQQSSHTSHQANGSINSVSHRSNTSISTQANEPMQPPQTPPSKNMALPSSMMTTPGGSNGLGPATPGQNWDFAEFVNITPSPAQKAWRTPRLGLGDTPRMGDLNTPRPGETSGRTPRMNGVPTPRMGGLAGFGGAADENVNPNTGGSAAGGRTQRTPRTRANGKFEGFMQPPMASPMLGNRAASSRIAGNLDEDLETLR